MAQKRELRPHSEAITTGTKASFRGRPHRRVPQMLEAMRVTRVHAFDPR